MWMSSWSFHSLKDPPQVVQQGRSQNTTFPEKIKKWFCSLPDGESGLCCTLPVFKEGDCVISELFLWDFSTKVTKYYGIQVSWVSDHKKCNLGIKTDTVPPPTGVWDRLPKKRNKLSTQEKNSRSKQTLRNLRLHFGKIRRKKIHFNLLISSSLIFLITKMK